MASYNAIAGWIFWSNPLLLALFATALVFAQMQEYVVCASCISNYTIQSAACHQEFYVSCKRMPRVCD
jgi:hypothetical protein